MAAKKQKKCRRGHALAGKNLYKRSNGQRQCLLCQRIYEARRK